MAPGEWIAVGSFVLTIVGAAAALVRVGLKLSFQLGEISKTIKGHSRLLAMVPCLKPHCNFLSEEAEDK